MSSLKSVLTSVEDHIKSICKSLYHIRNIAFVTAKLDSCNSLLYGLPQHLISRLQFIQNTVARVVTRTRKFDHITSVLKQLHWRPVRHRIVFKILPPVCKSLNGTAPSYISELLTYHTSTLLEVLRNKSQRHRDKTMVHTVNINGFLSFLMSDEAPLSRLVVFPAPS